MSDGRGWYNEPNPHGLAARGIKLNRTKPTRNIRLSKKVEEEKYAPDWMTMQDHYEAWKKETGKDWSYDKFINDWVFKDFSKNDGDLIRGVEMAVKAQELVNQGKYTKANKLKVKSNKLLAKYPDDIVSTRFREMDIEEHLGGGDGVYGHGYAVIEENDGKMTTVNRRPLSEEEADDMKKNFERNKPGIKVSVRSISDEDLGGFLKGYISKTEKGEYQPMWQGLPLGIPTDRKTAEGLLSEVTTPPKIYWDSTSSKFKKFSRKPVEIAEKESKKLKALVDKYKKQGMTKRAAEDRVIRESHDNKMSRHSIKSPPLKQVKVYDNGGETSDRFTIILPDGAVIGMSTNPTHPQGFNQYVGEIGKDVKKGPHLGKKVDPNTLPGKVKKAIEDRMGGD